VTPIGGDPVTSDFVLDIGANLGLQLQSAFVAEHHLPGPGVRTINQLGAAGVGGNVIGKIGRVASFKVGGFEIKSPVTMFQEGSAGPEHGEAQIGSIGQRIAARFRLFLDYSHDRIILEPTAALTQPFNDASAGVHISADGSDYKIFRVAGLLEDAPAVEAGLRIGDVIQAIDGRKASDWTLTAILDLFRKPAPHKLSVLRGDKKLEITISPRQMI
jgi:membrane-associated protease RseP (regulator of RpoE activity)